MAMTAVAAAGAPPQHPGRRHRPPPAGDWCVTAVSQRRGSPERGAVVGGGAGEGAASLGRAVPASLRRRPVAGRGSGALLPLGPWRSAAPGRPAGPSAGAAGG